MKITGISVQAKNSDRVNVSVDGKYRFSLDVFQLTELGIRVGADYTDEQLNELENESQFGKLYARALEYTLMRPHSAREIRDYLWRKTRATKYKSRQGEIKERAGASQSNIERVYARLGDRGYIDDEKFTRFWVENRNQRKGTSKRKLSAELKAKGVETSIIEAVLQESTRDDRSEIKKVIEKKRARYDDRNKLIAYLARQGFGYDDIVSALNDDD